MDIGSLTGAIEIDDEAIEVLDRTADRAESFASGFDSSMSVAASSVTKVGSALVGFEQEIDDTLGAMERAEEGINSVVNAAVVDYERLKSEAVAAGSTVEEFAASMLAAQDDVEGLGVKSATAADDIDLLGTKSSSAGDALGDELAPAATTATTEVANLGTGADEAGKSLGERLVDGAKSAAKEVAVVAGAITVVTGAITGLVGGILALGSQGATVLGVEDAFNKLAATAGSTGDVFRSALTEGVKGTIDSMVLMQSTTRLLQSGVKLTADDLKVMASLAREVGKATGTDATQGLETLSSAMLTGNQRALRRYGITVDLIKAETDFASSLGTTRSELSQAGRVEAARIAMLEAMRTRLDVLGESEVSLREKIQQVSVWMSDQVEDLSKLIAASPNVSRAFDAIKSSLVSTFGGANVSLIQTMVGWVNDFADAVARWGPVVITAMGTVRDKIIDVWNWLLDFNERWGITDNLVRGAKAAWDLLKGAFDLVKSAVEGVKSAWAELPEWLQRITKTAIEGTLALAAYSTAIGAVAAPMSILVSQADTAINIVGNLTGAIYSLTNITWLWMTPIRAVTLQYQVMTAMLYESGVAMTLLNVHTRATTFAKAALTTVVTAATGALTALSARLGLTTLATTVSATATGILTAVKTLLGTVVLAVSLNYNVLVARLGLARLALLASSVASGVATTALTGLGVVLLAIQAIPIVAALAGIVFGLQQVGVAIGNAQRAHDEGKTFLEFMAARDTDTWLRRWTNYFTQFAFGVDTFVTKVEEARRRVKGGGFEGLGVPTISPGALAVGSQEFQAAAAERERLALRAQGIGLVNDPADFIKAGTEAEKLREKIKDLYKEISTGGDSVKVAAGVFDQLTASQLANFDVLSRIVPELRKLEEANVALTPAMQAALDTHTRLRIERASEAAQVLAHAGLTQQLIDAQIAEGKTLEEVARGYSNNSQNIRITTDDIKAYTAAQKIRAEVEKEALVHAKEQSDRARAGARLLYELQEQNAEQARRLVETDTQTQIRLVKEANRAILDSHAATGKAREKIAVEVAIKEKREIDNILTDHKRVADTSKANLADILARAESTYRAMTAVSGSHTDAVIKDQKREVQARKDALEGLDVDYAALRSSSRSHFEDVAITAENTYKYVLEHWEDFSPTMRKHFQLAAEGARQEADGIVLTWRGAAVMIASAFADLAGGISPALGKAASALAAGLEVMVDKFATAGERISAGLATAAQMLAAFVGDSVLGATAVGALSGAAAGVSIGFMLGGIPGAGIGAGIGAVVGGIMGLIGALNKKRDAEREAIEVVREHQRALLDQYDTLERIARLGELFDISLVPTSVANAIADIVAKGQIGQTAEDVWLRLRVNPEEFEEAYEAFTEKMELLQNTLDKYNLTWKDLNLEMRQMNIDIAADAILEEFKILTEAGVPVETAIQRMSGAFSQLIIDAVDTGTMIPAAMAPVLRQMLELGLITDEAAKALLGLRDTSMPSLEDIRAAAERYGIELDELGPKVKQLEITELANQYVADWKILTAATDDWGVLFDKMGPKVQSLVLDAIKYGSELPFAMKPMIQAFIDSGRLVDDTGEKLTDLSQLTFAADLGAMFETLMEKLDKLIDKIAVGVGGALTGVGNTRVPPIEVPYYYNARNPRPEDLDRTEFAGPLQPEIERPISEYRASGGPIYAAEGAKILPFPGRPQGTDTVPVWATPGERVLTVAQNREYESRSNTEQTVIFELGNEEVARATFRGMPRVARVRGVSRKRTR